jgi:catechol 2,3-dioxygenase-like lactoylglutathione lyase family enzyme
MGIAERLLASLGMTIFASAWAATRTTFLCCGLMAALTARAQEPIRPKIFGIHSVQVLASDYSKSVDVYAQILGRTDRDKLDCLLANQPNAHCAIAFRLRNGQILGVGSLGMASPHKLISHVAFVTDDASGLLKYLEFKGIEAQASGQGGVLRVELEDPEGHRLTFFQPPGSEPESQSASTSRNMGIIHVGFVVTNREKMDHFYRDILGFHLYWQGGMKDERVDWVSMQVPDGTDWIEYMLHVPENASKHLLGVMNHIALGVPDVRAAAEELKKNGVKLTEEPKIGRDGKWQLNLYDPDDTRVELMEFTPVEKPCCAEFAGPHPRP